MQVHSVDTRCWPMLRGNQDMGVCWTRGQNQDVLWPASILFGSTMRGSGGRTMKEPPGFVAGAFTAQLSLPRNRTMYLLLQLLNCACVRVTNSPSANGKCSIFDKLAIGYWLLALGSWLKPESGRPSTGVGCYSSDGVAVYLR